MSTVSRVSDAMRVNTLLNSIRSNQLASGRVQQQLATSTRLLSPSVDPSASNQVMSLQRLMGQYGQVQANLMTFNAVFADTDKALGDAAAAMRLAASAASASISSTPGDREAHVRDVQTAIDTLMNVANINRSGSFIFAGTGSTEPAFVSEAGGVRYAGTNQGRMADLGGVTSTQIGLTGEEVFGLVDRGVEGYRDLTAAMTVDTRLMNLTGTAGEGIRLDTITINDGTNSVNIDLTGSDRVGDILDKINAAAPGVITASIAPGGTSLQIASTAPGADLMVTDASTGFVALDLGIRTDLPQGPVFSGGGVRPRITETTLVTDLAGGAALDLSSGLTITNGGASATLVFDTDANIGDLLNRINESDTGVLARINDAGDGIDILNQISGAQLRIGENGGSTAEDLGLRSLRGATTLDSLQNDRGVWRSDGVTDIVITGRDGSTFEVDLSTAVTIDDVIAEINVAAGAAGVAVTATMKTIGNGIELNDLTGGGGTLSVSSINNSTAAGDLGLAQSVASDTLSGEDVNPVYVDGVFSHLAQLRDELAGNADVREINRIMEKIYADERHFTSLQGRIGGLQQDLANRSIRTEDVLIDIKSRHSELYDTDYASAITEFQALQNAMQANLLTSAKMLSMSLLDFLR